MKIPGPYAQAWKQYKRRRLALWLVFLSYLPGMVFLTWVLTKLHLGDDLEYLFLLWAGAFMLASARLISWRCLRCGKFYHLKWIVPISLCPEMPPL